jgi:hypothetical protein
MGKRKKILLGAILVVGVAVLIASPLVLGLFGDDTGGNTSDGSTDGESDGDSAVTNESEEEISEEVKEQKEEIQQNISQRYNGPAVSEEFIKPIRDNTTLPPGIDNFLDADDLRRNTLATASEDSFVYNFYRAGSDLDGAASFIGARYNANTGKGKYQIFKGDDSLRRWYFTNETGFKQTIQKESEDSFSTENVSVDSPPVDKFLRIDELMTYIRPAGYKPINYTMVNNHQITILQPDVMDDTSNLESHLGASEILSYEGEVQVDEYGSLIAASITIIYEDRDGEQQVRSIEAGLTYGDLTIDKPSWVTDSILNQASGDTVELIDSQYFRIQPRENPIPANATLELSTATDQYTIELPEVEIGEVIYISLQDGELVATRAAPDTDEFIGVDYSLLVLDTDGQLIISDEQ